MFNTIVIEGGRVKKVKIFISFLGFFLVLLIHFFCSSQSKTISFAKRNKDYHKSVFEFGKIFY